MADRFYFRPLKSEVRAFEVVDRATVIGTIRNVVRASGGRSWEVRSWDGNLLDRGLGRYCRTKREAANSLAAAEYYRLTTLSKFA